MDSSSIVGEVNSSNKRLTNAKCTIPGYDIPNVLQYTKDNIL